MRGSAASVTPHHRHPKPAASMRECLGNTLPIFVWHLTPYGNLDLCLRQAAISGHIRFYSKCAVAQLTGHIIINYWMAHVVCPTQAAPQAGLASFGLCRTYTPLAGRVCMTDAKSCGGRKSFGLDAYRPDRLLRRALHRLRCIAMQPFPFIAFFRFTAPADSPAISLSKDIPQRPGACGHLRSLFTF